MLPRGSPTFYRSPCSGCPLSDKHCGSDARPEPSARLEVSWNADEDCIGADSETHAGMRRGPYLGD